MAAVFFQSLLDGILGSNNFAFWGMALTSFIEIPWYPLASGALFARHYQSQLSRISCIALLLYWQVRMSDGSYASLVLYGHVFQELLRSQHAQGGDRDDPDSHWTANIAEILLRVAFDLPLNYFFPEWVVTRVVFQVVFGSLQWGDAIFRSALFQLIIQKFITWIVRLDRAVVDWRDCGFEYLCNTVIHLLDNQATRTLVYTCQWASYKVYQRLTPDLSFRAMKHVSRLAILNRLFGDTTTLPWTLRVRNFLVVYSMLLRELARFSNPNPPAFKYSRLQKPDHIRLLLLHPRFGFRRVSCSMIEGPGMRILFYEAISYTWSQNPARSEEILMNGCRMMITKSAYEVLATYSSQFLPRLLWIDALCINQEDVQEKAQQVPMMGKVYSQALYTTIFLGQSCLPGVDNKVKGKLLPYRFDGLRPQDAQTGRHYDSSRFTFDVLNEFCINLNPSSGYESYEKLMRSVSKANTWSSILTLLEHPWFTRVWVVQEVALSPAVRVRYGDEVIEWNVMARALERISNLKRFRVWLDWSHEVNLRRTENSSLLNVIRMNSLRDDLWSPMSYRRKEITITDILRQSFYFRAADPRDQVYGLISLCRDKGSFTVDYQASVESVYLAAATKLVYRNALGLLFGVAGIGNGARSQNLASKLPSWVPDWTGTPRYNPIQTPSRRKLRDGVGKHPSALVRNETLSISAAFVDTIAEIGPPPFDSIGNESSDSVVDEMYHLWKFYNSCVEFLNASTCVCDSYNHLLQREQQHSSLIDAFHRCLLMGNLDGKYVTIADWAHKLQNFRVKPDPTLSIQRDEIYSILQGMDPMTERVESFCRGRRLFTSSKGYIGLCPTDAKAADIVCLPEGMHIPILLRDAGFTELRYQLVGDCYCQGLDASKVSSSAAARTIRLV